MTDGEGLGGDGPPRKRMRGPSQEVPDIMNSPGSPDIQPLGQRRRLTHAPPAESDEPLPDLKDIFDSPSTSRIIRGRSDSRGSPLPVHPKSDADDIKLTRFALTMPEFSRDIVRLAWQQSSGDARQASALLQDQAWVRNARSVTQQSSDTIGRVKAIDEANKAQRAAARQMGKQSLIYANRPAPRILSPPPTHKASVIPAPPMSPEVSRPRAKRAKKAVIDSDSEDEQEEQARHVTKRQKVSSDESRALEYFNNAALEGLQELTGAVLSSIFSCW